ncbi:MAG TPA: phosphate ABC transporter substrate-binding/OmpA family protein [Polyangia bacterium]|nr:phosphate ABC transporter substrate-binding/OmpA family protein [Polyangia bacterium]
MAVIVSPGKAFLVIVGVPTVAVLAFTLYDQARVTVSRPARATAAVSPAAPRAAPPPRKRPLTVALSQWPGHLALVVGNGGLTTQLGSAAAAAGLDLQVVFIEDAPSKNKALQEDKVDAVWETVDELPIALGGFKAARTDVRAFIQIDWSRGGDACVASKEVQKVEDVFGRKAAVLMFSPDHTVLEFMLTNSRLTPEQVTRVRNDTAFSMEDFTYARLLFAQRKIDVACLWEPDVTLALAARPGAHRLFSTADATELVADTLVARRELLDRQPDLAAKLAQVWFAGVKKAEADRPAAARLIATVCSRFRDELGYEATLKSFNWVKWTDLADNVRMFGLDGQPPVFDRVYNQADGIWINYPQAEIKERFTPASLRDDRIVRRIWDAEGRPVASRPERYQPSVAATGRPLFTKPITVTFHTGQSEITSEGMALLNQHVVPQVQMAAGMYIRVEGNTDNLGDDKWNQGLSERRAESIVEYLVSRGVNRERIVARGNGSSKPVASNRSIEGRARNRRTEILFIPSKS